MLNIQKYRIKKGLVTICLAILPIAIMLWKMQVAFISDTDYYWHAALGKNILETHSVTDVDQLSWIAEKQGLKYINHSWLSDILLYGLSTIGSTKMVGAVIYGIATMFFLGIIIYSLWGYKLSITDDGKFRPKFADWIVITVVTACIYETRGNPRPQQISLILFAISYRIFQITWNQPHRKLGWLLPIISIAWANLHGGTLPMLLGLNIMYLVLSLIPSFSSGKVTHKRKGSTANYIALLAANVVAGCINPYGVWLYSQFFKVDSGSSLLGVTEWQASSMENAPHLFIFIAIVVLLLVFTSWKVSLEQFLPLVGLTGMTLLHIRTITWLSVVFAAFVLNNASLLQTSVRTIARKVEPPIALRRIANKLSPAVLPICTIAAALVIGIVAPNIAQTTFYREFPDELIKTLETVNPKRMYTGYNVGGVAIDAGYQSFVDSRADLFTEEILTDFTVMSGTRLNSNATAINEVLDKYNFDAILLAKYDRGLAISYFDEREDWTLLYTDGYYSLYVPTTGANQFAAEYMRLNVQTNPETDEIYKPVYLAPICDIEYVAPSDILEKIDTNSNGVFFFTDASNNKCRGTAGNVFEWVESNEIDTLYVCNIEDYRMRYSLDEGGNVVITQNRATWYDELVAELNPILPAYTIENGDENTTLDVKTIEPPMLIQISNDVAKTVPYGNE